MNIQDDERAVSPVLGAVLLAGILVLLISVLQTQAVPAWNEEVEFDHNQRTTADLERLQSTILRVSTTGTSQPVTVELGALYPQRVFLRNFASDPSGSLATEPPADLAVGRGVVMRGRPLCSRGTMCQIFLSCTPRGNRVYGGCNRGPDEG